MIHDPWVSGKMLYKAAVHPAQSILTCQPLDNIGETPDALKGLAVVEMDVSVRTEFDGAATVHP
jgi:hypothetical protein